MKNLLILVLSFTFQISFAKNLTKNVESKKADSKMAEIKSVDFDSIKENQVFKSPFKVKMKVSGLTVRPAGEDVTDKKSGHHHMIIDGGPVPAGQPIPANETHIHYGKGQTEAELNLKPGDYTLTLQFADGAHLSYGPDLSKTIRIKVSK
jgi:hypothetical protein